MTREPRYKICRRLGSSVYEKCQTQKFTLAEQRKSKQRRGRRKMMSDFGKQLLEKQRARYTYGLSEKQLRRYVNEATRKAQQDPVMYLLQSLEMRLDNVIYRMGLASTRRAARQMVSHGHITVNGRKVNVPSYPVTEKDAIGIREGSKNKTLFADLPEKQKEATLPSWVSFDPQAMTGSIKGRPAHESIEPQFDTTIVLEFYSR